MDRFQTRLDRIKSPAPRDRIDFEKATPQELRWNQLTDAARVDTELRDLIGAFVGACASVRLQSVDKKRDMGVVADRLEEINRYLRGKNKRELCVDNLADLPPIQWEGYQR